MKVLSSTHKPTMFSRVFLIVLLVVCNILLFIWYGCVCTKLCSINCLISTYRRLVLYEAHRNYVHIKTEVFPPCIYTLVSLLELSVCLCVCRDHSYWSMLCSLVDPYCVLYIISCGSFLHHSWSWGLRLFRVYHTQVSAVSVCVCVTRVCNCVCMKQVSFVFYRQFNSLFWRPLLPSQTAPF